MAASIQHRQSLVVLALALGSLLPLYSSNVQSIAAEPGSTEPSQRKSDPSILIGPSRVTLSGGKTIEAIAVFREKERVRVVLEDGTEIALDPAKVLSVVALADLEPEAERPVVKTGTKAPARGEKQSSQQRRERTGAGEGAGKGGAIATTSKKGAIVTRTEKRGAIVTKKGSAAPPATRKVPATGSKGVSPDSEVDRTAAIEDFVARLEEAIRTADLEDRTAGMPGAPSTDETGPGIEASPTEDSADERPKPEGFDATRSVIRPGIRYVGKAGKLVSAPPYVDYPKPVSSSFSFAPALWRPTDGFRTSVRWPKPLPPGTSFSNRLTGLGKPTTSLGPSWWTPKPVTWPSSIFPENWEPTDGFARSQEKKNPEGEKPKQK